MCLFSMAGIPPCIGFFGKFFILLSAINVQNVNFMVIIAILTSVISSVYYLKIIKLLYFDKLDSYKLLPLKIDTQPTAEISSENIIFSNALVIAISTLIIMLFILNPIPLINIIHIISFNSFLSLNL